MIRFELLEVKWVWCFHSREAAVVWLSTAVVGFWKICFWSDKRYCLQCHIKSIYELDDCASTAVVRLGHYEQREDVASREAVGFYRLLASTSIINRCSSQRSVIRRP